MPTEELEHELRRAFTAAVADYQDAELARQRLLRRTYQPRGGHRRLAAGFTAAATAAAVAAVLALSGALSPARETGAIRTAAFTLTRNANGTDTLTITDTTLFNPRALQDDLARYGIPAKVTVGRACYTLPPVAGLSVSATGWLLTRMAESTAANTFVINPALIPAGAELSIGYLPVRTADHDALEPWGITLISPDSYTCANHIVGSWPGANPSVPMLWRAVIKRL